MKYPILLFLVVVCCSTTKHRATEIVMEPVTSGPRVNIGDTSRPCFGVVNVLDYGAKGDGITDDYLPIQKACDQCIMNPKTCTTVMLPVGRTFRITKSIMLQKNGQFFAIRLSGELPAKSAPDQYLSKIVYDNTSGFAIGIEIGKGVTIENLQITGKYFFPTRVNNKNIATYRFSDWNDGSVKDSQTNPYAAIVIDPYPNPDGSRNGTSGVEISQCAIKNFMVGICLTPNVVTDNDEMINILDDNIDLVRVAIAIGQDQSKEIHIDRLKVWASTHTVLDGVHYGRGTGGGSVMIGGGNMAGNINQLFNIRTDRFPLSVIDLYAESLFKIGNVGSGTGANFVNCQIDFMTGPGIPAPDYIIAGQANFSGGSLRYYDGPFPHRMNFINANASFSDMTMNCSPITVSLYGAAVLKYPVVRFNNVYSYYQKWNIKPGYEAVFGFSRKLNVNIDPNTWTGNVIVPSDARVTVGEYIIAAPTSKTGKYFDQELNLAGCPTIQIGRISKIMGDSVYIDQVGLNAYSGSAYDAFYIDTDTTTTGKK